MDLWVVGAALLSGAVAVLVGAVRGAAGRRLRARARAAGLVLERRRGRPGHRWVLDRGRPEPGSFPRPKAPGPGSEPRPGSAPGAAPGPVAEPRRVLPPRLVRSAASLLLGAGLALTVSGLAGLLLGVLTGAAGYRWLPEPPSAEQRRRRQESASLRDQLPLTADLLAGCLSSWCAPAEAAEAVAEALGEPMASRLARVAAEIRTGADPEESWGRFGADPVLGPLGRCLVRASASGAPPSAGLARLAEGARTAAATAAQGRVRRAGVLAAAPLGLCFLPAFVLIGVVPVVTGLAGSFLVQI